MLGSMTRETWGGHPAEDSGSLGPIGRTLEALSRDSALLASPANPSPRSSVRSVPLLPSELSAPCSCGGRAEA